MLNKAERCRILEIYKILGILGQHPNQVDLESWQLKAPSSRKRCVCFLFFGVLVLHAFYKTGSLAYAYFFDPSVQLHQLVIHAFMAMGTAMCVQWYGTVFISDPLLFAKYFNWTVLGSFGGPFHPHDELQKAWTRRLREYSMQDLVASNLLYLVTPVIPFMLAVYIYDPTMRLLLYNALPSYLQNWATFGLLLLEEARLLMFIATIVVSIRQLMVTSYDLVSNHIRSTMRRTLNGVLYTRNVYRTLRTLQLYVSVPNNVNSYLIFTYQLLSITASILTGYSAVAHFHQHPLFGVLYYLMLIELTFVYTVIYEKAFKIPQLFDEACTYALLHSRGKRRGALRREILSIPRTGIKVGNFHRMERASTLLFIDFVLSNIVSMLVAYG